MGTKYTTTTIVAYNATPPADDGSITDSNKVKYAHPKEKLGDPLKAAIESIDTKLVTSETLGPVAIVAIYTITAADHKKTIEASGTFTVTLSDAASLGAGTYVLLKNTGSGTITVGRATGTDTINGVAGNITIAAGDSYFIQVIAAATGFIAMYMSGAPANLLNGIINGGCRVAQVGTTSFTLTTAAKYGQVDQFTAWASAGAVSAGTIDQNTASGIGTTGYSFKASGITLTGSAVMSFRHRMEARDAKNYKNKSCSFGVLVSHDVGSNVNYTIIIRKVTTTDDVFSAVTVISTSSAIVVPTGIGTATQLKFENVAMGDCSHGIEIEIQAACGAITTKNFELTEWQFSGQASLPAFSQLSFAKDLADCQRSLPVFNGTTGTDQVGIGQCISTSVAHIFWRFSVSLRVALTSFAIANPTNSHLTNATGTSNSTTSISTVPQSNGLESTRIAVTGTGTTLVAGNFSFLTASNTNFQIIGIGAQL